MKIIQSIKYLLLTFSMLAANSEPVGETEEFIVGSGIALSAVSLVVGAISYLGFTHMLENNIFIDQGQSNLICRPDELIAYCYLKSLGGDYEHVWRNYNDQRIKNIEDGKRYGKYMFIAGAITLLSLSTFHFFKKKFLTNKEKNICLNQ